MEWVASTIHTTSERGVSSITTADAHNSADAPADVNGLVRFAERRNLVSAGVSSHFKLSLQLFGRGVDEGDRGDFPGRIRTTFPSLLHKQQPWCQ
jgi:hypothetical protein